MKHNRNFFILPIAILGIVISPIRALGSETFSALQELSTEKNNNTIWIEPFGSSCIGFYSLDLIHNGNGSLTLKAFFICRNVNQASLKGTIQELGSNGIWKTVDTFSTSTSANSNDAVDIQFIKSYSFQKYKRYRAVCNYQANLKSGGIETKSATKEINT